MQEITPMHLQSLTSDFSITHRNLTKAGARGEWLALPVSTSFPTHNPLHQDKKRETSASMME